MHLLLTPPVRVTVTATPRPDAEARGLVDVRRILHIVSRALLDGYLHWRRVLRRTRSDFEAITRSKQCEYVLSRLILQLAYSRQTTGAAGAGEALTTEAQAAEAHPGLPPGSGTA